MKIAISFPPLKSEKGIPLLSQNRQFQWFNSPTYIYPMIPASAATLLKKNGHEVIWDDGIAEKMEYDKWLERIVETQPDIIAIETKTPVVKKHWQIINDLKAQSLKIENPPAGRAGWKLKIVLMGDHVTALPEESMKNCDVDFVIQAGDFDFILLSIANKLSGQGELEGGIWYKENSEIKNSGAYDLHKHSLDELPMIDRELTHWKLYAFENGNFKYTPGSYMMSGRDCWWGKCSFCSWTTLFPGQNFRTRSAKNALDEVGALIGLGVKEIMEDSGTLPIGDWLKEFCEGMIARGYNKKVTMSCNMRINAIKDVEIWKMMKATGFRLVLFGLESANQLTLDRLNKNLKVEEIENGLKICKQAGLEPHITAMMGYPWETLADAQNTVVLAKNLFKKGYVDTLQATIVIPYPGTPLHRYCNENNLLNFEDYDRFDQREQVMKSALTTEDVRKLTQNLYRAWMSPSFIARKVFSMRNVADFKYLFKATMKLFGHLMDFK
ncbi:MAG: radical SAM protein [Candidatus Falkowbacteria bacterium]